MPPSHTSEMTMDQLMDYRLKTVEEAVKSIAQNFDKLVVLEQKHTETREAQGRAFDEIKKHDERIKAIELEMPMLKMTKNWIISGVIGVFCLVGVAVVSLVVITRVPGQVQAAVQTK